MSSLKVIIVNKNATLTPYHIKEYTEEKLFKKCGFKSATGFGCFGTWSARVSEIVYTVCMYGKTQGKATSANTYEFPPTNSASPVLLLGNALLVGFKNGVVTDLTVDTWKQIKTELFGKNEDLATTALEDLMEEDELANIPTHMKTKSGYLKDDFVVTSDESNHDDDDSSTVASNSPVPFVQNHVKVKSLTEKKVKVKLDSKPKKNKSKKNKETEEIPEKKEILLTEEEYEY